MTILNDNILTLTVPLLSLQDSIHLSQTSHTLGRATRRRLLSSLRVEAPAQSGELYNFLLKELGGYRLQCLRKLTITRLYIRSSEETNGYVLLARVIEQAQNLQTLAVFCTEGHLKDGPALGEAIARLCNLDKLDLCGIEEHGLRLCSKLTRRPSAVRLTGGSVEVRVDSATFYTPKRVHCDTARL
ncbi:hypothetical protein C8Q72DRAFT_280458 [Fomitopsis betulina]|nr:hypothetical protein C8Q72DRAFT_280458 [Fomitopsis betulina]